MSILPEITKEDLLLFVFDRSEKTFFKDFSKLCNNFPQATGGSKLARQTMTNYLEALEAEGLLEKVFSDGDRYRHYAIPKDKIKEVTVLKESRQSDLAANNLSLEERMTKISKALVEREKDQILFAVALNGWLRIHEIVEKTGIEEKRVLEAIWGKVDSTGMFIQSDDNPFPLQYWLKNTENDFTWPHNLRSYGLSFAGTYFSLKKFPESFGIIMNKWSEVHPFLFKRFAIFQKYGLEEALREYVNKLDPINFSINQDRQIKDIEYNWIIFVPRMKGGLISNWFDFVQEDCEFRERVTTFYRDSIAHFKERIFHYEYALKTMDNLGSRKPDKQQLESDKGFFVSIL